MLVKLARELPAKIMPALL